MVDRLISVALPVPLYHNFSYLVPPFLQEEVHRGSLVKVELKNRSLLGWVVAEDEKNEKNIPLKPIVGVAPIFPLSSLEISLAHRIQELWFCSLGEALSLFTPPLAKRWEEDASFRVYPGARRDPDIEEIAPAGVNLFLFREKTGLSRDKIRRLVKKGIMALEREKIEPVSWFSGGEPQVYWQSIPFFKDRVSFITNFCQRLKTEGKKGMVIFPDLATLDRYYKILATQLDCWHLIKYDSRLSSKKRFFAYKLAEAGDYQLILGTRLALFLPAREVSYYLILDPADRGHFSDQVPGYDSLRILEERVKLGGGRLEIVGSVPSLEEFYLIDSRKVSHKDFFPSQEVARPEVKIVTYRAKKRVLTLPVQQAISQTLSQGGRAFIWVQKTGYSSALGCRDCGFYYVCPRCEVAFRYHIEDHRLICPWCGLVQLPDAVCPQCGGAWLEAWGEGVERVWETVSKIFSRVSILRMDREERKRELPLVFPSIVVGTSLLLQEEILSKGDLLVMVSVESWLSLTDFRAREKLYGQVQKARLFLGTESKTTPRLFLQIKEEKEKEAERLLAPWWAFYREELEKREGLGYPPYSVMLYLIGEGGNRKKRQVVLTKIGEECKGEGWKVMGPFPSAGLRKRGSLRDEMVIIFPPRERKKVLETLSRTLDGRKIGNVQVFLKVDQ